LVAALLSTAATAPLLDTTADGTGRAYRRKIAAAAATPMDPTAGNAVLLSDAAYCAAAGSDRR
jgi:hypothetical protein